MTKAELTEMLNRSRARYKVLLDKQNQRIKNLEAEIKRIKKDFRKFGTFVERRWPRT